MQCSVVMLAVKPGQLEDEEEVDEKNDKNKNDEDYEKEYDTGKETPRIDQYDYVADEGHRTTTLSPTTTTSTSTTTTTTTTTRTTITSTLRTDTTTATVVGAGVRVNSTKTYAGDWEEVEVSRKVLDLY